MLSMIGDHSPHCFTLFFTPNIFHTALFPADYPLYCNVLHAAVPASHLPCTISSWSPSTSRLPGLPHAPLTREGEQEWRTIA